MMAGSARGWSIKGSVPLATLDQVVFSKDFMDRVILGVHEDFFGPDYTLRLEAHDIKVYAIVNAGWFMLAIESTDPMWRDLKGSEPVGNAKAQSLSAYVDEVFGKGRGLRCLTQDQAELKPILDRLLPMLPDALSLRLVLVLGLVELYRYILGRLYGAAKSSPMPVIEALLQAPLPVWHAADRLCMKIFKDSAPAELLSKQWSIRNQWLSDRIRIQDWEGIFAGLNAWLKTHLDIPPRPAGAWSLVDLVVGVAVQLKPELELGPLRIMLLNDLPKCDAYLIYSRLMTYAMEKGYRRHLSFDQEVGPVGLLLALMGEYCHVQALEYVNPLPGHNALQAPGADASGSNDSALFLRAAEADLNEGDYVMVGSTAL